MGLGKRKRASKWARKGEFVSKDGTTSVVHVYMQKIKHALKSAIYLL